MDSPLKAIQPERLASLDVLRGLDMIFLIALQPLLLIVFRIWDIPGEAWIKNQLTHCSWVGFHLWDLVMPLFLLMSGVTLPFALAKHREQGWRNHSLWLRLFRRIVLLWVLGGICQGNFLALNPDRIYLFTNTLQAIAVGTLIAFPAVLLLSVRKQIALILLLLFSYWMVFLVFGNDSYAQGSNIADTIDKAVLGRFRDGASVMSDGTVRFAGWYHYTWILSGLNFGAQMLIGAMAGHILRAGGAPITKVRLLSMCGFLMVIFGWLLDFFHPVIKPLWTSSMVMVSSGYAFLLIMFFYWLVDLRNVRKPFGWVTVVGCNALLAYTIFCAVRFNSITDSLFFGLEPYLGKGYALVAPFATFLLIWGLLCLLYRQKLFLRA